MMKAIPNCITFSRIILSLALFFVKPLSSAFYAIYILCGCSDMIDGFIARKTGTTSRLGEKLDSIADLIMIGSLFLVLFPLINLSAQVITWIIFILVIRLTSMAVALKKYKTFAILHTYGNKLTGLALFIFPLLLLYIQTTMVMYMICFIAGLSAVEELAIHLTSRELHVNKQSIFRK